MDVIYTYLPEANPGGDFLAGVPLHDLTQSDLDGLPSWLLASVDACPFYRRVEKEQ